MHHYSSIAEQFAPSTRVLEVHEFGSGNINDTYLVTIDTDVPEEKQFVLQRINTQVFKQPRLIMQNMRTFTEHVRRRTRDEGHRWDCLRSGCNALGEETEHWEAVQFDPEIGAAILKGYLAEARRFLTATDYEFLYDSIRLIAFELGVRFFTDYLAGNVYFKVKYPNHNLQRALVQFKLTESIEAHEADIRHIIESMIPSAA